MIVSLKELRNGPSEFSFKFIITVIRREASRRFSSLSLSLLSENVWQADAAATRVNSSIGCNRVQTGLPSYAEYLINFLLLHEATGGKRNEGIRGEKWSIGERKKLRKPQSFGEIGGREGEGFNWGPRKNGTEGRTRVKMRKREKGIGRK